MRAETPAGGPVVSLLDGVMELNPVRMFPGSTRQAWSAYRDMLNPAGALVMPYGGFLVTTPSDTTVLVDAGGGPYFEVPDDIGQLTTSSQLPASLHDQGLTPESVDTVILTHLHVDHIGWVAPHGEPFFLNAQIHCHAADWEYFIATPNPPDERITAMLAGVADRVTLWDGGFYLLGELTLRHRPGHTPGSSIVTLVDAGGPAALIGDLVHSRAQFGEDWDFAADVDPAMAAATRRWFQSLCAATCTAVWGNHFSALRPACWMRIVRLGPSRGNGAERSWPHSHTNNHFGRDAQIEGANNGPCLD